MKRSIREILVDGLPYDSREDMIAMVNINHWRDRGCPSEPINGPKDPKRHSIMDAFRRLKLDGTVEEWCEGTITLAGHVPTND